MKFATTQPCTHKVVKQVIMGGNCLIEERILVKCANKEVGEKLCKHYKSLGGVDMGDFRIEYVVEEL